MAISDIYQLNHQGRLSGEVYENVYFYQREDPTGTAADLANAFKDDIEPLIVALTCNNLVFDTIRVVNLGSLTDFAALPTTAAGGFTTNQLPDFNAFNVTLRLNTRAVRPGKKRYGSIPAGVVTDNNITDPDYIADINALMAALIAPIERTTDALSSYVQVVVKRVKYTVVVDGEEVERYRLPETTAELVTGTVVGAQVKTKLSHQDTRGNGR